MSNLKQNGTLRWIPSYLRRQGQMTPAQKRAYRAHRDQYLIPFSYRKTIDLEDFYPSPIQNGPFFLEIGFGMGENLLYQAQRHPSSGILGIEVHKPGIGAALKKMAEQDCNSIRVMRGDARLILSDYLSRKTRFARVSILFPDPWPDPEHASRRIIQPDLIDLLEPKMTPQGHLHIATDLDVYRDHCLDVFASRSNWQLCHDLNHDDFRGPTQYESKGIQKGHQIHDLIFRFGASPT